MFTRVFARAINGLSTRGARGIDQQPLVHAVLVEVVVAWQHAQVLVALVVIQTDAAARVFGCEHGRRELLGREAVDYLAKHTQRQRMSH